MGGGYKESRVGSRDNEAWNDSYDRGGNILFYPHEEIIRFVNKFVRKRRGYNDFEDILPSLSADPSSVASLDLGCGIGRHMKFLDEFGLNPYGIDLSETAISIGKEWMKVIGKNDLAEKMYVASVAEIPFEDDFFDICVSHGVLDSMPRTIARQGMKEIRRVLKPNALMYLDLIMDVETHEGDEIVASGYEEGTVQSYFTVRSIKEFVSGFQIVNFNIISSTDDAGLLKNKRAHLIIKNQK